MENLLGKYNPIRFNLVNPPCLLILIASLAITACDNKRETSNNSSLESDISLQTPDSMLGYRLDQNLGILTADISGCPNNSTMIINDPIASVECTGVPTGNRTFTITFTYELAPFGPLVVATASKTINVIEGANPLNFVATDYDTDSHDEDGDGISNILELDENSTTSPVVALCRLGTLAVLGNCELGS